MNIEKMLQEELNLKSSQVVNTIKLIDDGNTIPFIARYRKEMTGNLSDVVLREFYDRLNYLRNLKNRKEDVIRIIQEGGNLTDKIKLDIQNAKTLQEVEDIYAPFKPKKRTRATIAKEKGLEKLAISIMNYDIDDIYSEAKKYIDEENEVENEEQSIKGALDIIAEIISEDASLRKVIRRIALNDGVISCKGSTDEKSVYEMYYSYSEKVKTMAPHRTLAINRGEKEKFLKVKLELNEDLIIDKIRNIYIKNKLNNISNYIEQAINDSYKRLIFPSIEREIRNHLTEKAQERAIKVFGENIKKLLLQPPVKGNVVMGFDPAYRTGCKIAIVDENSKLLDTTTIYPTKPQNDEEGSKKVLIDLINKYNVNIIAIGNGTASRESEMFVANLIKEIDKDIKYIIVSEAGASIYSASSLATEEHPDINVSLRGAISIARRLQDPLAELVKIDPQHIGVGQYQHDMNQKRLGEVLDGVVEDSVNAVGVDLNSASYSLLERVAGISKSVAKNIVIYRDEVGEFKSRKELKKVKRLGPSAFVQCAGFLRIDDSENMLDNTGVHPESYDICKKLIKRLGYTLDDIKDKKIEDIDDKIKNLGIENLSLELNVGVLTLKDIINEIKKPGRDPRDESIKPVFRSDVLKIEDIKEGMILKGTVRNVVDFGAFVDIGIKNDGLVHKSQMSDRFVKDPMQIVSIGDIVDVKVIQIDLQKHKVSLSMKGI
ncbi:Tex family protein [Tepidibacter aestuarii]|uniref:Tex family protein n=1 Tax=Tepidibacter aestuarii TaxID=2925782 RepID=UPI0020BD92D2|nr:Tex family protein [Tepidibacter aestuarii]CAH2211915.1 RNA helicase transcriptional accessory protein [Tepidibacter aestuarii]